MRIAYIVPYVPNLIRTRPYNLIVHLGRLGHEVSVFTLGSNEQDRAHADSLRAICEEVYYYPQPVWRSLLNCMIALPSSQPLQSVYSWRVDLAKKLITLVDTEKTFDVIHVEHLRGSRYGVYLKSRLPHIPLVWDSVDCISHLFKQASSQSRSLFGKTVTRLELSRTQKMEAELVSSFDRVLVTSPVDKQALLELVPNQKKPAPVSVLSNGVDLEYFQPNPATQRDPETLIFCGKMSYHANVSMVKYLVTEIMPRIWGQRPAVQLLIVGKDPPADVRRLADNSLVTVTGTVNDIRPYLWKSTIAVAPLIYGAGVQNKILEAMAAGIPVVTTSRATSALRTTPGVHILVADTPEEFSFEILRLLENQNLQHEIGMAGLRYVQKNHNWNDIAGELVNIYQETIFNISKIVTDAR